MFGSLYDFAKSVGKKIFTSDAEAGNNIREYIEANNPGVNPIQAVYDDGCVTLSGFAESQAAKEECILLAGNVEGVEKVVADNLEVFVPKSKREAPAAEAAEPVAEAPAATPTEAAAPATDAAPAEARIYEIQKGDTLWAIAAEAYGNGARYTEIVAANPNVIDNPDRIYPGQKIRIP